MNETVIRKINSVENFGSLHGFKWRRSIPEFKRYNLIYGWNGSGKTTLSRLFRYISEEEFRLRHDKVNETKPVLEIELKNGDKINTKDCNLDKKVKVFNADYITENLRWDECSTTGVILFVGKVAAEKKQELEDLEKNLASTQKRRDGLKISLVEKNKLLDKWLNEAVLPIRTDTTLTGNAYNINKFKSNISQAVTNESRLSTLSDEELTKYKCSVKEINDKGILSELIPELKDVKPSELTNSVNEILSCSLIPNEDEELQLIENDKEIFSWVEKGVAIHSNREACLFCGERYIQIRRDKLTRFFQTQQAELIDKIDKLTKDIEDYTKQISVTRCSDSSLFQEFRTEYQQKYELQQSSAENLTQGLLTIAGAIEWKKSHLFDSPEDKKNEIKNTDINSLLMDFKDKSKNKEDVIKNHNTRVDTFDKAKKQAEDKIIEHHVKSLLPKYKEHLNVILTAQSRFDDANAEFNKLSQKISNLKSEVSNAKKGADAINIHLESMGHGHIRLDESDKEIGYILTRMGKRAQNLSEGEKTAVAVAFFINSLKDSNFKVKDSVLVIDDPVSSLDANVLFFVFSMIQEYTPDASQLFILTHNHQFFARLLRWKGNDGDSCVCYEVRRDINKSENLLYSTLHQMDGNLIHKYNEYYHLFFMLYSCTKSASNNLLSDDYRFTHLNIARRVLECFFGFWYPGNKSLQDSIDQAKKDLADKDTENYEALCQSVYVVINLVSHSKIDAAMGIGEVINSETPDVTITNCLKIIEELAPKHHDQMRDMCENASVSM